MSRIVFDISMSLDGFITGANRTHEEPLGDGGEHLHDWAFNSKDEYNRDLIPQSVSTLGAVICGRRTYDDSLPGWGTDGPTGSARIPVFVVTHNLPKEVSEGGVYTFVTDGINSALQKAKKAAGEKNVTVMGGADLGQQYIKAGLVDELPFISYLCSSGAGHRCSQTSERRTSSSNLFKRSRPLKPFICGFVSSSRQRSCRMDQQEDFAEMAKGIIDSILYMVLGTADESGQPWVSPAYFTPSKYKEFYWISSPEMRHSRNIAQRSQVSIVIFNSQVPAGKAQAVYMSAVAEELTRIDLERGLAIYNGRFPGPARHGVQDTKLEQVRPPGFYRLYRAVAVEHWVLDPYASPDRRTPVLYWYDDVSDELLI